MTMTTTSRNRDAGAGPPPEDPVIVAEDLGYDYGAHRAVDGLDLRIDRGEIFALLGTNGAGKTTTLELLQGFRTPTDGVVTAFGVEPHRHPAVLRRRTGVVLQEAGHFGEITVSAQLDMWAALSSRVDDVERVLYLVELTHRAGTAIDSLSGGERRRLDLAMAIWGSPELVVLDEPTTGLDPESRRTLWSLVRDLRDAGTTIILTTHYLEEAEELADRVAIMHRGRTAVSGTLDEVLATRPSRIQVDVPDHARALFHAAAPGTVTVSDDARRRAADPGFTTLEIVSHDQQGALAWLLDEARGSGVNLGPLRASPASLDEVFHHVRNSDREEI